jgi:protein tyrosine phosphatase
MVVDCSAGCGRKAVLKVNAVVVYTQGESKK